MSEYQTIPLRGCREYPIEEMRERIESFFTEANRRRTVREFSDRPVPRNVIETALRAAPQKAVQEAEGKERRDDPGDEGDATGTHELPTRCPRYSPRTGQHSSRFTIHPCITVE